MLPVTPEDARVYDSRREPFFVFYKNNFRLVAQLVDACLKLKVSAVRFSSRRTIFK